MCPTESGNNAPASVGRHNFVLGSCLIFKTSPNVFEALSAPFWQRFIALSIPFPCGSSLCDEKDNSLIKRLHRCNHFNSGRLDVYAENLIKDYGLKWFNKLVQDAWSHTGYSVEDMLIREQELKNELEKYE